MTEHTNQAQQIWQSQPVEGIKMSVEEIRRRAGKFERRIVWRNRREIAACVLVCGMFAYFMVGAPNMGFRISYGLFIVGMIWVAIQLQRKASVRGLPESMGAASALQFFRGELVRQRDSVRNVWPWYLAPTVPGYVVLNMAWIAARPARWWQAAVFDVVVVGLFIGIWKLNRWGASCLQRKIDELDAAANAR